MRNVKKIKAYFNSPNFDGKIPFSVKIDFFNSIGYNYKMSNSSNPKYGLKEFQKQFYIGVNEYQDLKTSVEHPDSKSKIIHEKRYYGYQVDISPTVNPNNVLLLCSEKDDFGLNILEYYKNNRPGMKNAHELILNFDSSKSIKNNIIEKIGSLLVSKPEICFIITFGNWPRDAGHSGSFDVTALSIAGKLYQGKKVNLHINYNAFTENFLYPAPKGFVDAKLKVYDEIDALVTGLTFFNMNDAKAYIDKIANAYTGDFVISGQKAGVGGGTAYVDDNTSLGHGLFYRRKFSYDNYNEYGKNFGLNINYKLAYDKSDPRFKGKYTGPIKQGKNPLSYISWGEHNNIHNIYSTQFTGNNQWWIGMSGYSFNANGGHMNKWFKRTNFGGGTPIGTVGHTAEPQVTGINDYRYDLMWNSGYTFAECAWLTRDTNSFAAFGDPLVTR